MSIILDGTNGITTPALENDGVTTVAAGSASAPAITTDGDTNTGIFFPAADTIAFAEGGAEAMRITDTGTVAIGTTTKPTAKLWVESGRLGLTNTYKLGWHSNPAHADLGNYITGDDATNYVALGTGGSERMRIDSSGNVSINTTSNPVYGSTDARLNILKSSGQYVINSTVSATTGEGHFSFRNPNGVVGSISTNGSSTSYVTSSDYRLKENIAPMTGALLKIAQLKPCTYTWKVDGSAGEGFIAHELAEVCPDAVSGEKDAVETYIDEDGNEQTRIKPQGIDTSFLVATLTAAIQELSAKNDALEARIAALEGAK